MQKRWRELWGLNDALPPDCTECRNPDGGGLVGLGDFLIRKHPRFAVGLVSSTQDGIIRLFYSSGNNDCKDFETADMVSSFLGAGGGMFSGETFQSGLEDLRARFLTPPRNAAYFLSGGRHQHLWRPRFFEAPSGGMTIARWLTDFLQGQGHNLGP